jgi:hypothetical protein
MNRRHVATAAAVVLVLHAALALVVHAEIPPKLSDQEFWKLSSESSEPDGTFRSDNLVSNESYFQYVIPSLNRVAKPGRVYLGVGPEQNFTYMAALKPAMAFIIDIRRGNLDLQLLYKAIFELSKDRAEFAARLFGKTRPDGLTTSSTAREILDAIIDAPDDDAVYASDLQAVRDLLMKKHGFPMSDVDQRELEWVYSNFHRFGPRINYGSSGRGGFFGGVTYWNLMIATDAEGVSRSYLSSEEDFKFLKSLESNNLVVPIVGNFAGPKAIRAVGKYLKEKGGTVSAFYLSNVEQFLQQDRIWDDFCASVSTLPLDDSSTFIRSVRGGRFGRGVGLNSDIGNMAEEVKSCVAEGPAR